MVNHEKSKDFTVPLVTQTTEIKIRTVILEKAV